MTRWRDIPSLLGKYQASSNGSVRSLPRVAVRRNGRNHRVRGKELTGCLLKTGYVSVCVGRKSRMVHQLVAEAFHGPRPSHCIDVNHLNGVKSDNRPENLEWCTRRDNVLHAIRELGSQSGAPGRKMPERFGTALAKRNAKSFRIVDPLGIEHTGTDLKAFCAANNLPYPALLHVKAGRIKNTTQTQWRLAA